MHFNQLICLAIVLPVVTCNLVRPAAAPQAPLFSWPAYPTLSYATPVAKPKSTPTYARPFKDLAYLVKNQTTTTWASIASPTDSSAKYGNVAWSALWASFNITTPPFTTTVSPTLVPSSELVKPTPLPFPEQYQDTKKYSFPAGFLSGFTGAALQVEGAVRTEGRGPTYSELILLPREETAKGGGKPDITNLNYFLYKQDIARLAAVGVKTYAFSISWSRILPFGVPGSPVNQEAIKHYDDLINTVLEYGMIPVATLHHFDSPLTYATSTSYQGWDHPDFVEGFVNYAQIALIHYSDRIGTWITFNEPTLDASIFSNWASGKNIVMAHAEVVHWYREVLKGTGKWSMKFSFSKGTWLPLDPSNASDVAATVRAAEFGMGHLAHPLFLGLPVPASLSSTIGSRAPNFTAAELEYVKGTCDFMGVDIYGTAYFTSPQGGIDACVSNSSDPLWPSCIVSTDSRDGWDTGATSNSGGHDFYQHMRTVLKFLDTVYPAKDGIMITEIGFSEWYASSMTIEEEQSEITQSVFYQSTLNEVLKSIHEDGVNVIGFLGWSYVNNWEWGQYDDHYGVQAFNRTTLQTFYKRSIFDFVDFINAHSA
ncbi:related to beta-glucosidase [Phialocephala subalpina]|uniref:Related to beta-glucosidase n=1 Tax=Phialocephala subalpina TaxID=576137 RepID=A0A1L7XQG5_9HELO|nr:related to beta-glucosidase [Phialocephala subalpina]